MRMLRRMVLRTAPEAAESIRFGCLCYFHAGAPYSAIGGNICMIEQRRDGAVALAFIHGAMLPDPDGLLRGRGKAKRFVMIDSLDAADDPRIIALVRAAAASLHGST